MNECFAKGCSNNATTEFCRDCLMSGGVKPKPLLIIELQDETSVPRVFYQGEEITGKIRVSFDWETRTDELGGTMYNIDYAESKCKEPIHKGIGLARGKYVYDKQ